MPTGFGELEAAQKFEKGSKNTQTLNTKQADIHTTAYDESMLPKELECCYKEFIYYRDIAKNDTAALGWAVSYNLQALWQNSPKVDTIDTNALQHTSIQGQTKHISQQEQQRLQEIQSFLQSKGIEPLTLRYTPYPRDTESQQEKELRQRAEKYSHYGNATHTPRDHKRPIRFYTTLDWDKFYMQFPLIKRLSKEYLGNKEHIYSKAFKSQIHKTFLHTNIMTILKQLPKGEHKLYFAIDVRDNRSDKNVDSYILVKENESIPQGYKLISACKPYEIDTLNFQVSSFADQDFFKQARMNALITIGTQFSVDTLAAFTLKRAGNALPVIGQGLLVYEVYDTGKNLSQQTWNETMRDLSLYACSGKFSINYAPTCITIKKDIQDDKEKLEYRIDEMVAYVYDSFDFLDQYHIFNDDGTISKLGQPVGAWDFEEKAFSIWGSIRQMLTYKYKLKRVSVTDVLQSPQTNQYYIYNQDYQDYQKFTPYGLDFRLYSKNIIKTLDFKDLPFETLYSTIG
ncbi:DUF6402 family protein [Helicobacter didelphidarum]|nr:DUF6402 family protein [Helicobacter didelphidarum]